MSLEPQTTAHRNADGLGHRATPPPANSSPPFKTALACAACRQRKVKCDKSQPCSACRLHNVDCVPPVRTSITVQNKIVRRRRNELDNRLQSLEGLINRLVGGYPDLTNETHGGCEILASLSPKPRHPPPFYSDTRSLGVGSGDKFLGRSFWSGLAEEFRDLRDYLNDDSEIVESLHTPQEMTASETSDLNSIFESMSSLRALHPPKRSIIILVDIYFSNVDPILKLLHRETVQDLVTSISDPIQYISRAAECLLFSIYYASITSLNDETCREYLGQEKSVLLARFRRGTEVALKQADLLNSVELIVLQALIIFLVAARFSDESRSVWALTGLAVRLALALGLHRDGDGMEHPKFDAELRRRTWWQVYHLEWRASEDRGSDPGIHEHTFDTILPLNINEVDLVRGQELMERQGITDMTFSLMCFEACGTATMLNYTPPKTSTQFKLLSLKQRYSIAQECCQRLQIKYFAQCDPSIPYQRFILLVGRLITGRIQLSVHYPLQRLVDPPVQSKEVRDNILETAVRVLEAAEVLETDKDLSQWVWLAHTHVPWHAFAVVLAELCIRPNMSRAWTIVEKTFSTWAKRVADMEFGAIWRPIRKLYMKAQAARQQLSSISEPVHQAAMLSSERQHLESVDVSQLPLPLLAHDSSQVAFRHLSQGLSRTLDFMNEPFPIEQLNGVPGFRAINDNRVEDLVDGNDPNWVNWDNLLQGVEDSRNVNNQWPGDVLW